jgi:hypothetical protein
VQENLPDLRSDRARVLEHARFAAEMHDVVGRTLTVVIDGQQRTLRVSCDSDQARDDALHHPGHDLFDVEAMIEEFRTAGNLVRLRRTAAPIHAGVPLPWLFPASSWGA